ncbi:unnamed protein product [Dicrocoelium dendriticum]|nr:unnamed protein product [Dicrocoelium dendriticum]
MVLCFRRQSCLVDADECRSIEFQQSKPLSTAPSTDTLTVPVRGHGDRGFVPRLGRSGRVPLSINDGYPLIPQACPSSDLIDPSLGTVCDFRLPSPLTTSHHSAFSYCCFGHHLSKTSKPTCDKNCLSTMFKLNVSPSSSSRICWPFSLWCNCAIKYFRRRRIPNENLLVLSIIQMLCGFASIILSSVALTRTIFLYHMATGMWAGFLMLLAGTQGLITARRPIVCTMIGLLILCIVVTIAASLLIGVSVAGIIEDGFLNRENSHSKSTVHVVKFAYAFQGGGVLSPGSALTAFNALHPSQSSNRTNVNQLRVRALNDATTSTSSDAHFRACQVIIHLLLLLIGILGSSVSLSTSVLGYRFIHSRARSDSHTFPRRTNIVSLDSATASQAAAVLQSGDINRLFGSDVLLAVGTHSLANQETHLSHNKGLNGPSRPYLHHTVTPFLPDSGRSALILTQAGVGSVAWTAARAAASLLGDQPEDNPLSEESLPSLPSLDHFPASLSRRIRAKFSGPKQSRRPRLLITSLETQSSRYGRTEGQHTSAPDQLDSFAYPPGSTLLYVIPSPSRDDPPMVFPPFPPTYSSLQKRPSHAPSNRPQQRRISARLTRDSRIRNTNSIPCGPSRSHFPRRISPNRDSPRRLFPLTRRRRLTNARTPNPRSPNSSLICAIDRLLQPVLIVEDPKEFIQPRQKLLSPNPPEYSAIDQRSRLCAPND